MKRNMALIKCLLEHVEEHDAPLRPAWIEPDTFKPTFEVVRYHVRLIKEAGFVHNITDNEDRISVGELTWAGHEYLEQLRTET